MTEPGAELVPFGKHKGKPVEVLAADRGYAEWLLAQPWFRDKFPTVYQTIINYAGEPTETPEHNQMQASFLDDAHCLALARQLLPADLFDGKTATRMLQSRTGHYTNAPTGTDRYERFKEHLAATLAEPGIYGRKFEDGGWDVVFSVEPSGLFLELTGLPACVCRCDHAGDCPGNSICRGGDQEWDCRHRHGGRFVRTFESWQGLSLAEKLQARGEFRSYGHCNEQCVWRDEAALLWLLDDDRRRYEPDWSRVRVECKPDLGDDFPAVLRQVTRYDAKSSDSVCVLVRRHSFEQVTWEQVTEIFRASGITLISEARLEEAGR